MKLKEFIGISESYIVPFYDDDRPYCIDEFDENGKVTHTPEEFYTKILDDGLNICELYHALSLDNYHLKEYNEGKEILIEEGLEYWDDWMDYICPWFDKDGKIISVDTINNLINDGVFNKEITRFINIHIDGDKSIILVGIKNR